MFQAMYEAFVLNILFDPKFLNKIYFEKYGTF